MSNAKTSLRYARLHWSAGCMFSRAGHRLLVRTSSSTWFTVLFMLVVIGQKWLFVYWSLTEVYFSSPGRKDMANQYSCVCLHSDRSPQERKANLLAFKVTIPSYTREVIMRSPGRRPLFNRQRCCVAPCDGPLLALWSYICRVKGCLSELSGKLNAKTSS